MTECFFFTSNKPILSGINLIVDFTLLFLSTRRRVSPGQLGVSCYDEGMF